MLRFGIFFLSVFFYSLIWSQDDLDQLEVHLGPQIKENRGSTLQDIVGHDENGFYALKRAPSGIFGSNQAFSLEHYDFDFKLINFNEVELLQKARRGSLQEIVQFHGELYMLNAYRDKQAKRNSLFVESIDRNSLKKNKDLTRIAEINYQGYSNFNSGSFSYELSRDSSTMLVFYSLPFDPRVEEAFGLHVFGENLEEIWKKEIKLPYESNLYDLIDFQVDEQGNVFILGRVFKQNRRERKGGEPNYIYEITAYFNNGRAREKYQINIKGKFLSDMKMTTDIEGKLLCAGFYGAEKSKEIIGSYFLKIDPETKAIVAKNFDEFGIEFITQNMMKSKQKRLAKRAEKGKNVDLFSYKLDDIIIRRDGGAFLIGEQYYVEESNSQQNNIGQRSFRYVYNDIIVINKNLDGTIKWTQKIAKRQSSIDDFGYYSSYSLLHRGEQLFFVFNDNAKNLGYNGTGRVVSFSNRSNAIVTMVELRPSGKQIRQALYDMREARMISRPKVSEQISPNMMILFGEYGRNERFVRLRFD